MAEPISVTNGMFQKVIKFNGLNFHLQVLTGEQEIELVERGSVYAFVQNGQVVADNGSFQATFQPKMYLSLQTPVKLKLGQEAKLLLIHVQDYLCLNTMGGPLEKRGRLRYINGCSDTVLLPPSRLGEPCLNLLHFPENTNQTEHHHPSLRFGIVVDGEGESVSGTTVVKLKAGDCFHIPAMVKHKFNTYHSAMNVIAFHPDSDWGPTNEVHPMINRTII